jgi:hypothetical protein
LAYDTLPLYRRNVASEWISSESREESMPYPSSLNSRIVIPKNITDRDIADARGFDVESADGVKYIMVRRRPENLTLAGHLEFLANIPLDRLAQAEAAVRILNG